MCGYTDDVILTPDFHQIYVNIWYLFKFTLSPKSKAIIFGPKFVCYFTLKRRRSPTQPLMFFLLPRDPTDWELKWRDLIGRKHHLSSDALKTCDLKVNSVRRHKEKKKKNQNWNSVCKHTEEQRHHRPHRTCLSS